MVSAVGNTFDAHVGGELLHDKKAPSELAEHVIGEMRLVNGKLGAGIDDVKDSGVGTHVERDLDRAGSVANDVAEQLTEDELGLIARVRRRFQCCAEMPRIAYARRPPYARLRKQTSTRASIAVRWYEGWPLGAEVRFRIARRNSGKRARRLREIEAVQNARGSRVGKARRCRSDRRQVENLFDEL